MCLIVSMVCARLKISVQDRNSVGPYLRDCVGISLRIMFSVQTDVYLWVIDPVEIIFSCTKTVFRLFIVRISIICLQER